MFCALTLPVAVNDTAETTLAPVMLPCGPVVAKLAPYTLPVALTSLTAFTLLAVVFNVTFKLLITLPLKLKLAPRRALFAVIFPAALTLVTAFTLLAVVSNVIFKLLITLPLKLKLAPRRVLFAVIFPVAVISALALTYVTTI